MQSWNAARLAASGLVEAQEAVGGKHMQEALGKKVKMFHQTDRSFKVGLYFLASLAEGGGGPEDPRTGGGAVRYPLGGPRLEGRVRRIQTPG